MYVDGIRHFLFLISRHNFNASPRANRSRYQKSPGNFSSPMSWDHVDRVWWQSSKKPMTSISNSRACAFYITLNSWLPVGRSPMTCNTKVVRHNEIYMCTEFHMNMCKYVWAIHQHFWLCSRGRRRAPVPRPGPSLCRLLKATDSKVCANFQEFLSMLRTPKAPTTLTKNLNTKP